MPPPEPRQLLRVTPEHKPGGRCGSLSTFILSLYIEVDGSLTASCS